MKLYILFFLLNIFYFIFFFNLGSKIYIYGNYIIKNNKIELFIVFC